MPASFFDTNVLVYLASEDVEKADRAERLVAEGGAISVQVLNELASVARRKMRMSWPECRALLSSLQSLLEVRPLTVDTHAAGVALAERYGLSIYDSMIAAAALEAKCDVLWSEDMQHGLRIAGLNILNPFQAES